MSETKSSRAHLITGGFPPGSSAGHDHDHARLRLLGLLAEQEVPASVANDFSDIEKWLPDTPDRERWSQEEPLTHDMKEPRWPSCPRRWRTSSAS